VALPSDLHGLTSQDNKSWMAKALLQEHPMIFLSKRNQLIISLLSTMMRL